MTHDNIYQKEREFHDAWAANIDIAEIPIQDYFEACTAPENRFILRQLGDLKDKTLLDLGCGAGENSVYFALQGVHCVATDYSPGMVEVAKKLAALYEVEIEGRVANAMALDFPANSFDIVYAANLLHHLPNPTMALQEMYRVVKPGGKVCFWDPLRHNPVINVYRRMASHVRTEDEYPLSLDFVQEVRSRFAQVEYDAFWLSSLWIFLQFYVIEGINPNEERYWKKIIREHDRLRSLYLPLETLDSVLKKLPLMKRMCWNLAVVATK